jgi:tetrapyrrole methylase family protein/MazG family protein
MSNRPAFADLPLPENALDWIKAAPDGLGRLLRTLEWLRSPGGCAWDRKQTHESLKRYAVEEAHELGEAVDGGDPAKIREELGDLLLQVVFHAQLGWEAGTFDFDAVAEGMARKLWSRHEHVFGAVVAQTPEAVEMAWEQAKKKEREGKAGTLAGVPKSLPALSRAYRLGERAARVGFDWPDPKGALDKVAEEAKELVADQAAGKPPARELGDLLFALVNVARHLGCDPEEALQQTNDRFTARFGTVEELARQRGLETQTSTLAQLDALWDEAKASEKARG